jgi:hypothetical protein
VTESRSSASQQPSSHKVNLQIKRAKNPPLLVGRSLFELFSVPFPTIILVGQAHLQTQRSLARSQVLSLRFSVRFTSPLINQALAKKKGTLFTLLLIIMVFWGNNGHFGMLMKLWNTQ